MNNVKKIILIGVLIVILTGATFGVIYLISVQKYKKIIRELKIKNVNLEQVANGTYNGEFDAGLVGAKVKVTVKDHKITDIKLVEHKNGKGKKAEIIPERVVKAQSLEVDTVTGATNSSKVILKAIENALEV